MTCTYSGQGGDVKIEEDTVLDKCRAQKAGRVKPDTQQALVLDLLEFSALTPGVLSLIKEAKLS